MIVVSAGLCSEIPEKVARSRGRPHCKQERKKLARPEGRF